MNRPSKKKKQENAPDVDERNLVSVDEAFQEADLDDRLWLWWQKNRSTIIFGVLAVLLVTVGVESFKVIQRKAVDNMQADYNEATAAPAALREFGSAHPDQPLGGIALLAVADEKFQNGAFSEATALYAQAASALEATPVQARARLGQAMGLLRQGEDQSGTALLSQVANDPTALAAMRAEAAFHLGVHHWEAGNREEARQWLDQASQLDETGVWETQVESLQRLVPALTADASGEDAEEGETVDGETLLLPEES